MATLLMHWIALCSYLLAAALALAAANAAKRRGRSHFELAVWGVATVFMLLVALSRAYDLEELARQAGRAWVYSMHAYHERWNYQAPLAALISVVAGAVAFACIWLFRLNRSARRSRPRLCVLGAQIGMALFLALFALRILSLHLTDMLLYSGPIRLNWVLDGALTLLLAGSAWAYVRDLAASSRPNARR